MDGPRGQGEVAGRGSFEETGFSNAITPRFFRSKQQASLVIPILESFWEMIRDKNGFGNGPPGHSGSCLVWSIPLGNAGTKVWPGRN